MGSWLVQSQNNFEKIAKAFELPERDQACSNSGLGVLSWEMASMLPSNLKNSVTSPAAGFKSLQGNLSNLLWLFVRFQRANPSRKPYLIDARWPHTQQAPSWSHPSHGQVHPCWRRLLIARRMPAIGLRTQEIVWGLGSPQKSLARAGLWPWLDGGAQWSGTQKT
jgi:hypothetical protein